MSNPLIDKDVEFEERMNVYMERLYRLCGYGIIWNGDQKKDVTLIIDGKKQLVEHKYRRFTKRIWNDILVEIMQDMVSHNLGWIYICGADCLHYVVCQGEENNEYVSYYYDIDMSKFKAWFFNWLKIEQYPKYRTSLAGYGVTLNIAVPLDVIPKDIIKRYDYDL